MLSYSAYFFRSDLCTRLDAGEAGESWREPSGTLDEFPELAYLWRTHASDEAPPQHAVQVTDSVVLISKPHPDDAPGRSRYLDVRRGRLVPPPPRARWTEPGVGVDGWIWERGCALAPGPTVLAIRPDGNECWTVHVSTGTWTGPFPVKPSDMGDPLDPATFVVLPGLADPDARTIYIFKGTSEQGGDGQAWTYDLQTGEGIDVQSATDQFPGLATFGGVVDCAAVAYGSFDLPGRARHTRQLSDGFFDELRAVGQAFEIEPVDLALVLEAISGLRAGAYHPAGRFGFLQLSADELAAIGLNEPEHLFDLTALRQLDVVRAHLGLVGIHAASSAAHLWAALLLPGFDAVGAPLETIVAARKDPDSGLYERLVAFDPFGRGSVSLNTLDAHLLQLRTGERWNEIVRRVTRLPVGPLAPVRDFVEFVDWVTADVDSGSAKGILHGDEVTFVGPLGDASVLDGTFPLFGTDEFTPRLSGSDDLYLVALDEHLCTVTFTSPVQDPVLQLASLGSVITFAPGTIVTRISGDEKVTLVGSSVTGTGAGSLDGNATIGLSGVFMTIAFTLKSNFPRGARGDGIYVQVGGSRPTPTPGGSV